MLWMSWQTLLFVKGGTQQICCLPLQGDATPSPKAGDPAVPQATGKERQPVVYPERVHWQGPQPRLPAGVLQ